MTDQTPALRQPAREIRTVDSPIPILDTGYFEHMQRIAGAMAQGSLIPETLRGTYQGTGQSRSLVPFEQSVVVANVFRVVNQAVRWNMDPFAVIDCASVVHGRLMWEGKLVHAVIEARVGIRLNFRFGRIVEGRFDSSEEGKGEALAVQVFGTFDDETEERTVEGTVAKWKTTGNNSPWSEANWKRQLRYRGAREWARAHSPGVMLGVVTNDETLEEVEFQERTASARARTRAPKENILEKLNPTPATTGFDPAHVDRETAPKPEQGAESTAAQEQTPHDPKTGEVIEGTATDVTGDGPEDDADRLLEAYNAGADAFEKGQPREVPSDMQEDDEAEAWLEAWDTKANERAEAEKGAGATDGGFPGDPPKGETASINRKAGPAPKGQIYLLVTALEPIEGKLPTFKDGKPFSKVGPKGAAELVAYDAHPEPEDPALASQSGGTGQTRAATPEEVNPPGDIATFWTAFGNANAWGDVKKAIANLFRGDDVGAMTEEDIADLRSRIWTKVRDDHADWKVDPATDPTAFRLWMESVSGDDAVDQLVGCWRVLKREAVFEAMKPENQTKLQTTVEARIVALGGTVG